MSLFEKAEEQLNLKKYANNKHLKNIAKKLYTKPEKVLLGLLCVFSMLFLFTKFG